MTLVRLLEGAVLSGEALDWAAVGGAVLGALVDDPTGSGRPAAPAPGIPPRGLALTTNAGDGGGALLVLVPRGAALETARLHAEALAAAAVAALCRAPALRHMPLRDLQRLASHMRLLAFEAGDALLAQGAEVAGVFVLVTGAVQLRVARVGAAGAAGTPCLGGATIAPDVLGGGQHAETMLRQQPVCGDSGELEAALARHGALVGMQGPGALLGDDVLRERRMGCSVVAASRVTALRLPPHKLPQLLEPLTLRLLARLRPQTGAAAALAAADAEVARDAAERAARGHSPAGSPLQLRRSPSPGGSRSGAASPGAAGRPEWRSAHSAGCEGGAGGAADRGNPGARGAGQRRMDGEQAEEAADHAWALSLPKGLTDAMAAALPGCQGSIPAEGAPVGGSLAAGGSVAASVQQLADSIRGVAAARKAAEAAGTCGVGRARACQGIPPQGIAGHEPGASLVPGPGGDRHTDLMEAACVAVVRLVPPPGQAHCPPAASGEDPGAAAALVDDAVAQFRAAAHDAGLRLVRWGAHEHLLLGELPPGSCAAADSGNSAAAAAAADSNAVEDFGTHDGGVAVGMRSVADCLLAMRARLAAVANAAPAAHMRLCAGAAVGSCFLQSAGGSFVVAASGRAHDAASHLADDAAAASPASLAGAILVSDAVRNALSDSHELCAAGGGWCLVAARAPPPLAVDGSAAALSDGCARRGGRRRSAVAHAASAAARRRAIRTRYEAIEELLARGDGLQRAPEHILTQPPPVRGARSDWCGRPCAVHTQLPANRV